MGNYQRSLYLMLEGPLVAGDLNADGFPELLGTTDVIAVLTNHGDGSFGAAASYPSYTNFPFKEFPVSLALGDLNTDGRTDVAVANYWGDPRHYGDVGVMMNTFGRTDGAGGASGFSTPIIVTAWRPSRIAVGDLNADGQLDLVIADDAAGTRDAVIDVLVGDGAGALSPETRFGVGESGGALVGALALADLNGDGYPDVALVTRERGTVNILLSDGTGALSHLAQYPTMSTALEVASGTSLAAGDLDGDGDVDLVVANETENRVTALWNDGAARFETVAEVTAGPGPSSVAVSDLNGDGAPDLIVANRTKDEVTVLPNDGHGAFRPADAVHLAAGVAPYSVAVADLDGDRRLDLAVAFDTSGVHEQRSVGVAVLLNTTP